MKNYLQHIGDVSLSPHYNVSVASLHKTVPAKTDCKNIIPALIEKPKTRSGFIKCNYKTYFIFKAPTVNKTHMIADTLSLGGEYVPDNCDNPDHVAIIVPYRDRAEQLPVFLGHIHPLPYGPEYSLQDISC